MSVERNEASPHNREVTLVLDPELYTASSESLMKQRGILKGAETMQDALERVVGSLTAMDGELNGGYDREFADKVVELVNEGVIAFGTPVLTNAGREQMTMAACTVLPVSVNEIKEVDIKKFQAESYAALDKAVGTGYDLSETESPAETLIALNQELDNINIRLTENNQRPVASMATLRSDHPEVREFIRAKRDVDFFRWRFNISVFVTEDLFVAAEQDKPWELKDNEGNTVRSVEANQLLREMSEAAYYCGEPGVLFKDRIDGDNPTPQWEYKSTAPCAEVAMAEGEACQFSYINVAELVTPEGDFNREAFSEAVRVMTRLLDSSVEITIRNKQFLELPLVEQKRRIGVGITGFADLLIGLKTCYDSPAATRLAAEISELLDYHSKVESTQLARQRGAFPAFPVSRFLDSEWIRRKTPRSTGVVSTEEWEALFQHIDTYGIRNASTTAMPPTGTSSAIIGSSKSLEPHFSLTDPERRVHRSVRKAVQRDLDIADAQAVMAEFTLQHVAVPDEETINKAPYLQTARQISQEAHLDVQASFQGFLDEALAKTINLRNSAQVDDVLEILWSAYRHGLKCVTVFRDGCLTERSGVPDES